MMTDAGERALRERLDDPNTWLPDDLERRWEAMTPQECREIVGHWQRLNAARRFDWRQRRRIRKLLGGPITIGSSVRSGAELDRIEHDRQERLRRIKAYGVDGEREIQILVGRLYFVRPGVPEDRALAWAEKTYRLEHP